MRTIIVILLSLLVLLVSSVASAHGVGNIPNGDFSDDTPVLWPGTGGTGYNHWRMEGFHNHHGDKTVDPDPKWHYLRTEVKESSKGAVKKGAPERYLEFHIVGGGQDGNGIALRSIPFEGAYGDLGNPAAPTSFKNTDGLQFDLTSLDSSKFYYLEADVRIIAHSLEDSGSFAGAEWPVIVEMGFADANNSSRRFRWGFLDGVDTQGLQPYTQIDTNRWYHYRSLELRTLCDTKGKTVAYPIDRIHNLQLRAQGHNLKSDIANVDIVEYAAPQVSSPDDNSFPCPGPP